MAVTMCRAQHTLTTDFSGLYLSGSPYIQACIYPVGFLEEEAEVDSQPLPLDRRKTSLGLKLYLP